MQGDGDHGGSEEVKSRNLTSYWFEKNDKLYFFKQKQFPMITKCDL